MKNKFGILSIIGICVFFIQFIHAENNWKINLKNAYIDREYDSEAAKDAGSWSQGVSIFYTSDYYSTPINNLNIGLDASTQYAVRLSNDRHVSDSVLPFDEIEKSQENDFYKIAGTLKLKYNNNELRVGELWPDLPVTPVDGSRQLVSSYLGSMLSSKISDKIQLNLGRIDKVSARNSDEFKDFSYTYNNKKIFSDGLNFIDLRYKLNNELDFEYYYGSMDNLFNKHYVGLNYNHEFNNDSQFNSKVRYFNAHDDNTNLDIDSQYLGFLETLSYKKHNFGIGYQEIIGDTFPLLDGYIPELYFINWNTIGFFKENEKSIHFIYTGDYSDYVPGVKLTLKHVIGFDFKDNSGRRNKESETDFSIDYGFQSKSLKGLSFKWLVIPYSVKYGNDFVENRIFLNYTKKF